MGRFVAGARIAGSIIRGNTRPIEKPKSLPSEDVNMSTPVSKSPGYGPNLEMSVLGYITAICIAAILLPLLPFVLVGWVLWRIFRSDEQERTTISWRSRRPPQNA